MTHMIRLIWIYTVRYDCFQVCSETFSDCVAIFAQQKQNQITLLLSAIDIVWWHLHALSTVHVVIITYLIFIQTPPFMDE